MTMVFFRQRAYHILGLVGLGLGGCVSEMPRFPSEPGPVVFQPTFLSVNAKASSRGVPNRIKYSDKGHKPSGDHVQLRALLGKNGVTTVEAVVGSFDAPASIGRIEKVHLRMPTLNNRNLTEKPQSRLWSRTVQGLTAGDTVETQSHLRYLASSGMSVEWNKEVVSLRPDLAVTGVYAASRAALHAPVVIRATISENNAAVGAWANCVLSIDGIPVDEARGIWVDAGDAVDCQFIYMFRVVGAHQIRVSLRSIQPGDYDEDNNSALATIDIVPPGTPIPIGTVQVDDEATSYTQTHTRAGAYPISATHTRSFNLSALTFSGGKSFAMTGDIQRVVPKISVDGTEIFSNDISDLSRFEYDDGFALVRCTQYSTNEESWFACVTNWHTGGSQSDLNYSHTTSATTYFGQTVFCSTVGCEVRAAGPNRVVGTGQRYGAGFNSVIRFELSVVENDGEKHVLDRNVTLNQDDSAGENFDRTMCFMAPDNLGQLCRRTVSTGTVWRGLTSWDDVTPPAVAAWRVLRR